MGKLRWVVHSDASYAAGVAVCWATVSLRGYEGKETKPNDPMRAPHHAVTVTRSSGGAHAAEIVAAASGLALAKNLEIQRVTGGENSRAYPLLVTDAVAAIRLLEGRVRTTGLRSQIAAKLIKDLDWSWGRNLRCRHGRPEEVRDQDRFAGKLRASLGREWLAEEIALVARELCSLPPLSNETPPLLTVRLVELPELQNSMASARQQDTNALAMTSPTGEELLVHHVMRLKGRVLLELAAPSCVTTRQVLEYAKKYCAHQFDGHTPETVRQWFDAAEVESIAVGLVPRSSYRMQALYARYELFGSPNQPHLSGS